MTERWEDTTLRGTFFGHSKPMYVLPVRWSTNPNERPKSGNLDPIILLPGVDYNNIEAKFQLSFKTKVLQGVFGVMVIYGGLYSKVPLANL
jgi:phospholipase A1